MPRIPIAWVSAVLLHGASSFAAAQSIEVHDATQGCFHSDVRSYAWLPVDGGYRYSAKFLSTADVEEIRRAILDARARVPDLVARVGVTQESIDAHSAAILDAALRWSSDSIVIDAYGTETTHLEPTDLVRIRSRLLELLRFERVAPSVRFMLEGEMTSTTSQVLEVEIPGDPPVRVRSDGLTAWKLPWKIESGGVRWTSSDIAISRALLPLVDPNGPNYRLLDGTHYWSESFWSDETFWNGLLSREIELLRCESKYARLAGFDAAMRRFHVDAGGSDRIDGQLESLELELTPLEVCVIDRVRWLVPAPRGKVGVTWSDLIAVFDSASAAVARQRWIEDWKRAASDRTIHLAVVGDRGYPQERLEPLLERAWNHAGLLSKPDFEIALDEQHETRGAVWLSKVEGVALIAAAARRAGPHWFDDLDLAFGLDRQVYGRVDASGTLELRSIR